MITRNPLELKDEILRRLGAPILKVEVTEQQIMDCIQRALELYGDFHYNGVNKDYVVLVPDENNTSGVFDLKGKNIYAVTKIVRSQNSLNAISTIDGSATYNWFSDFVMGMTGNLGTTTIGCTSYGPNVFGGANLGYLTQIMSYNNTMQDLLAPLPDYHYNGDTGQLFITNTIKPNSIIILEVYVKSYVDVEESNNDMIGSASIGSMGYIQPNIEEIYKNPSDTNEGAVIGGRYGNDKYSAFNNRWVKDYSTALVKELNGYILSKFDNMQLTAGVTPDGKRILQEAKEEKEMLRQELMTYADALPILII